MLTATKVRNTTRPGVYTDGPGRYGLTLTVKAGSYGIRKVWTQKLTVEGRRTMVGLGKVEFITLGEARSMAFDNARAAARGEPLVHGGTRRRGARAVRAVPTFAMAAEEYIKLQAQGWKSGSRNESNWRSSLAHADRIADVTVDSIVTDDVAAIVSALIRAGKIPTARSVRQRIRVIFDWCAAKGYRTASNPANGEIDAILPKSNHRTEHRASVEHGEIAEVLRRVRSIDDPKWRGLTGAFELTVLTATRTSEVLGMTFAEIDLDTATWTVPGARMKAGRDHRVPLSDAALSVLRAAHKRHGGRGLVFRSPRGKRIDEAGLRRVAKRIELAGTVHGMRGAFKSWAMESGIDRALAEMSLAHSYMGDVEASYVRTDLLEKRRPVMGQWARHVAPF